MIRLLTIRFDGSVEARETVRRDSIKGRLFRAHSGDVVFSKIDVRNGAIGLLPRVIDNACVTSEFPVYSVDMTRIDPVYVTLLFRTNVFRALLSSMISGASGRKRIQPAQLENVRVPIPPLPLQKTILRFWQQANGQAERLNVEAKDCEAAAERRFVKALGLPMPSTAQPPKLFTLRWSDVKRWSLSYNQAIAKQVDLYAGKYRVQELGTQLTRVQYGTSDKANTQGVGPRIIRMNNVVDGRLNLSDIKHIDLSKSEIASLSLKYGDILINRTNSKELVGKCAVFDLDEEFVFASYLIRLEVDAERINPHFTAYFLNSPLGRMQIDAVSRQIIGQANINSEEIRELLIVTPPKKIQERMMAGVFKAWSDSERLRKTAQQKRIEARLAAEEMILGVRTVPEK
jgi:hypothetical protein